MLDQDGRFYLISSNILITCLLNDVGRNFMLITSRSERVKKCVNVYANFF